MVECPDSDIEDISEKEETPHTTIAKNLNIIQQNVAQHPPIWQNCEQKRRSCKTDNKEKIRKKLIIYIHFQNVAL